MGWEKPKEATNEETLSFTDKATYVRTIPISVEDHLDFVQTIEQHGPISVYVEQKLNLLDGESEHIPERHIAVQDVLNLSDLAYIVVEEFLRLPAHLLIIADTTLVRIISSMRFRALFADP
jgi:hypothetical protein